MGSDTGGLEPDWDKGGTGELFGSGGGGSAVQGLVIAEAPAC